MFQYFFPQKVSGQRLLALFAGALAVSACAAVPPIEPIAPSSAMPMGRETGMPNGYADFCRRHPSECRSPARITGDTAEITRADDVRELFISDNTAANPAGMRTGGLIADNHLAGKVARTAAINRFTDDWAPFHGGRDRFMTASVAPDIILTAAPEAENSATATATATATGDSVPVVPSEALPAARMALLRRINDAINSQVQPKTDLANYGVPERWTMPLRYGETVYGDCEDYALEKRRALIDAGVPPHDLFLATAFSRRTGKHAVLIARTERGDYVLDNATARLKPWRDTPYVWLSRQDPARPDRWVRVPPAG